MIAFAILRDSVSTSRVSLGEQDNGVPGLLEGNSEGKVSIQGHLHI